MRGRVKAFSAKDGKLVWTFYTVPGPGEVGHDTWPQDNEIWQDGGAPVWNTPAVDPELGLIYFGTGNPGPDYNGSIRKGDNLFSTSIVALDAKTGKYRWHFQQVHHDIWDYDAASPVVLFDLDYDGVKHKAIAEASKTGWVYILDRTNGQPLVGIDEKAVLQEPRQATAPTQPYPRGDAFVPQSIPIAPEGTTLVNGGKIFTPFWTTPTLVKPGPPGGVNWPPSSYDLGKGTLFVCAADRIWSYLSQEVDAERPAEGANYIAGGIGGITSARARRVRGSRHADEQDRVAAALGRAVLLGVGRDRRRARVRRPHRRPAHRARLERRQEALGVSNGRGNERARDGVRVRRQTVRARVSRPGISTAARRAATASGCSAWRARSSPCRPEAR